MPQIKIFQGDCLDELFWIPDNSVDSLVTDPPAGISFMGKEWDHHKGGRSEWVKWMSDVMRECMRVMKPGAHGLVWALPRTSHWTAMALEDAGFEIRDSIYHIFGSGFPKSLDVSKAIDKMHGAERELTKPGTVKRGGIGEDWDMGSSQDRPRYDSPSTDDAKAWQGWGTALKPAVEVWWLIRKPISEKTVAKNVLKWGTGALNIDASRVEAKDAEVLAKNWDRMQSHKNTAGTIAREGGDLKPIDLRDRAPTGRFPSHLVLDEEAGVMLDAQSGTSKSSSHVRHNTVPGNGKTHGKMSGTPIAGSSTDSGGASRFFYCAKVSTSERNAGLEGMPDREVKRHGDRAPDVGRQPQTTLIEKNSHPTVKPQKLMRYLINLITPLNGTVFDPFMGSGSTGVATKALGFDFIGIEKEKEYFDIAAKRIAQKILDTK